MAKRYRKEFEGIKKVIPAGLGTQPCVFLECVGPKFSKTHTHTWCRGVAEIYCNLADMVKSMIWLISSS